MNDKFSMVTLQELIDTVKLLNADAPRVSNGDTKVGLYIEIKDYDGQILSPGYNLAELLFNTLDANNLGTISDCQDEIPIIIQSFEFAGLKKFATMSDLPLVQLCHYGTNYDFEAIG